MCGKYENKLYDSDSGPGQQLHFRSSPGERNGKVDVGIMIKPKLNNQFFWRESLE